MKFSVKHELPGRLRIHLALKRLTFREADIFQYYLEKQPGVTRAKVCERTADAAVEYSGNREKIILYIRRFRFDTVSVPESVLQNSPREMDALYRERLITRIVIHYSKKMFLPAPVRTAITVIKSVRFVWKGIRSLLQRRLDVSVLDAAAIGVSVLRGDTGTAGSVMFLLGIGDIIEEWTHKKSVSDLARSMALRVEKVWLKKDDAEILVPADQIREKDQVVVRMGNVIPFDGLVTEGDGMVNQSSMTGEPVPVHRRAGGYVYAGTVLEEGELTVEVREGNGESRFDRIVSVIEETEKLKSAMESRTKHLADRLVPYTLGGTLLTWLLTRNVTKTMSVLMVDFSCALKLAMPITILSAMREAGRHHITIKGGRFLEAMAEADTLVFDKTGTLTKASPVVKEVVSFCREKPDELLRIAACMEEHYPHSMAKAVVNAARKKGLVHNEMHTRIEYIVAHGISCFINGKKVILGSGHFVFEDEGARLTASQRPKLERIPEHYSRLFMAIDGRLSAVICIEDPIREEAADVIKDLKAAGFKKLVMMTGDNKRTAEAVANRLGLDEFYAEVLPEQKADFIHKEKSEGHKVVMVGDGINDSPALSAADAGIAISDGAEIAREIADITISADDLRTLVVLKQISTACMNRIRNNYRLIIGINGSLIALGIAGIIQPSLSAALHNLSTIGISVRAMSNLMEEDEGQAAGC